MNTELLALMEEAMEIDPGSIKKDDRLEDLELWDSIAIVVFMGMADANLGIQISADAIIGCKTVGDVCSLG
jgi:acyl carrier protein